MTYYFYNNYNGIVSTTDFDMVKGREYIELPYNYQFEPGYSYTLDFANQQIIKTKVDPSPEPIDPVKLLEAQVQALSDRNDFLEDLIAEMAWQVYSS